jgi:hypothetical protein
MRIFVGAIIFLSAPFFDNMGVAALIAAVGACLFFSKIFE